jgi:DNA-binding NtrC family response regulator
MMQRPQIGIKVVQTQQTTVLFVEDDPRVRDVLPHVLPAEFKTFVVGSGAEAISVLADEQVDVLFTDIVMPGINGIELVQLAKRANPDLLVIMMTGYISRAAEAEAVGRLMYKPLRPRQIEKAVREAIASRP